MHPREEVNVPHQARKIDAKDGHISPGETLSEKKTFSFEEVNPEDSIEINVGLDTLSTISLTRSYISVAALLFGHPITCLRYCIVSSFFISSLCFRERNLGLPTKTYSINLEQLYPYLPSAIFFFKLR